MSQTKEKNNNNEEEVSQKCNKNNDGGQNQLNITEEDKQLAHDNIQEYESQWELRITLRKNNSSRQKPPSKDSSIKKINAFLRKLKSLTDYSGNIDIICDELKRLKLVKFLSEIISILLATKISRKRDIEIMLKICSNLHTEYTDFSESFETQILKEMNSQFKSLRKIKDEDVLIKSLKTFSKQQRKNLRLVTEFVLVKIFPDDAVLVDVIKSLIAKDKKKNRFFIIPALIANFCKYAGEECTESLPRKLSADYKLLGIERKGKSRVIEKTTFEELNIILRKYYETCRGRLEKIYALKNIKENESTALLKLSGSLSDRKVENLRLLCESFYKIYSIVRSMSSSLDLSFPDIPPLTKDEEKMDILEKLRRNIIKDKKVNAFGDEETRSFYEDLADLSMYIITSKEVKDKLVEEKIASEELISRLKIETNSVAPTTTKKKLSAFDQLLEDMEDANNKAKIDLISERFCKFNSPKNRTKLIKKILNVKKNKLGQILFYSRLIATLSQHFEALKIEINEIMETRFYGMFFNKGKNNLTHKLKNIAFISELSKFDIFPVGKLTKIINKCLADFSPHSIQVVCALLENCGRWLYKNPLTHEICKNTLKVIETKSKLPFLEEALKTLLDMARYQCNPPPIRKHKEIRQPPEKAFVRFLLFRYLNENNAKETLKLLRKMDWNNNDMKNFIIRTFMSVAAFSFEKLPLVASIVAAFDKFYGIGPIVVDKTFEEIRTGFEDKKLLAVQKCIALIKFLGELFIYRLLSFQVIIDTLYFIITFCPEENNIKNNPVAEKKKRINADSKDNLDDSENDERNNIKITQDGNEFRIRLVCALLETCGRYFRRGRLKTRIDRFLIYFQRFVIVTDLQRPFDLDIKFAVDEIFVKLRPFLKRYQSLEEVETRIRVLENRLSGRKHRDQMIPRTDWIKYADLQEAEEIDTDDMVMIESEDHQIKTECESETGSETGEIKSSSEDDGVYEERIQKKSEEDIKFEKEFESTIKESIELRKYEPKKILMSDSKSYANSKLPPENKDCRNINSKNQSQTKPKFKMLLRRKGDSKTIMKEIKAKSEEIGFSLNVSEMDKNKRLREQNLMKENMLKRIIQLEMHDRNEDKRDL